MSEVRDGGAMEFDLLQEAALARAMEIKVRYLQRGIDLRGEELKEVLLKEMQDMEPFIYAQFVRDTAAWALGTSTP